MGNCALSERKIDIQWKPKIREDLFFNDLFASGNQGYCVVGCVENDSQLIIPMSKTKAFYKLLALLDGTRSIAELSEFVEQDVEELQKVIQVCYNKGFLTEQKEIERFNEAERLSVKLFRYNFKEFSSFSYKISAIAVILFRILFVVALVLTIYSVATNIDQINHLTIRTAISIQGDTWFGVVIGYAVIQFLCFFMGILHEIAHLAVSLKNKCRPNYIAFVLHMGFMPMAYVKQKSIYALEKKKIIEILFAGVIMNLFLCMIFANIYLYTQNDICKLLSITNLRLALINLVPFSLTDGYYIFSILTKKPNLRMNFFRICAFPREIKKYDKKLIVCYTLYLLTIILCLNLEVIILLNVIIKDFYGIWYLILIPVNLVYLFLLHRVNLRKFKNRNKIDGKIVN